ncbi:MAG: hypothetical protein BGO12_02750 [Verrucomicrobia bacterium 61-8]|nr:MAG: hypothetical protein BGO12_02750 [Verrucomicrobia bacterium 61-8]
MDKGKPLYQVDARKKGTNGKRESFIDLKKAEARAKELAQSIQAEGIEGMAVRPELRVMALQSEKRLAVFGKTIADATSFYIEHLEAERERQNSLTVELLVEKWLEAKINNPNKALRKTTARDIRQTGKLLKEILPAKRIAEVKRADIEEYLKLKTGKRRKENLRNRFNQFFNWVVDNDHYKENPIKGIEIAVEKSEVKILPIADAEAIFQKLEEDSKFTDLIPYFAVCCFGGLRPTEAELLTWEYISLPQRQITIRAADSKVKDSRNVEIEQTLLHWLSEWKGQKKGLILKPTNIQKRLKQFKSALGYKYKSLNPDGDKVWVPDIMRHSYASYSLALKRDYGHIAMQMGNSIEVIKKHYKFLVPPSEAQKYWNILPKHTRQQATDFADLLRLKLRT